MDALALIFLQLHSYEQINITTLTECVIFYAYATQCFDDESQEIVCR